MTFVQIEFVAFLAIVFTIYVLFRRFRAQNVVLLLASLVFYGWVHPWFLALLLFTATLDYLSGRAMARWPARKRWFLAASLTGDLGLLGYFKYADFFLENVRAGLDALGIPSAIGPIGVFLPVGISFYTFQSLSYIIDVYRGDTQPRRNLLDYFLFVAFFPQLVAGPILRADALLVQVERPRRITWEGFASGLSLALWGAFKKICVADVVADYVDKAFQLQAPNAALVAAATLGFGVQILADFSGYTDIARGVARMMGFELPLNFDHPYLAKSPSDFWRRWHISFSSWIRD
ncbi:MAG: MBOAT family protein, partial [Deltaproteobacteria bacterium]|nr:MBOAT family protein [Deltaproteobacteria bacterium]